MKELSFLDKLNENTYNKVDLPVYIVETQDDWSKLYSNFGHKFMPEIFDTVQMAIREDLLNVPVFKVLFVNNDECVTFVCNRNNFDEALISCIRFFEEIEEFEKCRQALNIIDNEEI